MISCFSLLLLACCGLGCLLVVCGVLLYRLGGQVERSDVQQAWDAERADNAEIALGNELERKFYRR